MAAKSDQAITPIVDIGYFNFQVVGGFLIILLISNLIPSHSENFLYLIFFILNILRRG